MKVFLVPPSALPVPATKGGAVETLLTHLIKRNEIEGRLELFCVSVPDEEALDLAAEYRHTQMIWIPAIDPLQAKLYGPWCGLQRRRGKNLPTDPWYNSVLAAAEVEDPDLAIAEGGDLTQFCGISEALGRNKCLAHLHGHTKGSPLLDSMYGGALALSRFIQTDYLTGSALPPEDVCILHNCIDTDKFTPAPASARLRTKLGFSPQDFLVVFCGRLAEDKGIHKLMDALALCPPDVKLLIVGSPFFGSRHESDFQQMLKEKATALQDRVVFTGYVPGPDLPDYYRLADLVCVPTLVQEAAGLVAIEAMACGCPVVATRSGGMPEYLEGSDAVLVEQGEELPQRLAEAIRTLKADPLRREVMGRRGAHRARDFSVEAYYNRFVEICHHFGGRHE